MEEFEARNVKAFYRKMIAYENLSEIFKIKEEYSRFKEGFENFEKENPEFLRVIKRNEKKIREYREKEKKMYSGILGSIRDEGN